MFRKFLLACTVLATFTIQTQAISINELNSSPQFKKVYQKTDSYQGTYPKDRLINYLNAYSVEALEYAAPHYKLKGTFYTVYTYTRGAFITEYEVTATYNTNYSLGSLIHASQVVQPSPSMYAVIKAAQDDSGIQISVTGISQIFHLSIL